MPSWTAENTLKLLMFVIEQNDVKVDYKMVVSRFEEAGETCTPKAISEQMSKLKKQAAAASGKSPVKGANSTAAAASAGPKTLVGKARKKVAAGGDDGDDEESPSKKRKANPRKGKGKAVKDESDEEMLQSKEEPGIEGGEDE